MVVTTLNYATELGEDISNCCKAGMRVFLSEGSSGIVHYRPPFRTEGKLFKNPLASLLRHESNLIAGVE